MNRLQEMINLNLDEKSLNQYGRFDKLMNSVDTERAREYLIASKGEELSVFYSNLMVSNILREFILHGNLSM